MQFFALGLNLIIMISSAKVCAQAYAIRKAAKMGLYVTLAPGGSQMVQLMNVQQGQMQNPQPIQALPLHFNQQYSPQLAGVFPGIAPALPEGIVAGSPMLSDSDPPVYHGDTNNEKQPAFVNSTAGR